MVSVVLPERPEGFPGLPDLQLRGSELTKVLRRADADARSHSNSPEAMGRLGMAYHSNQFYEQADAAYGIAARLDSSDYRWRYLRALLEEEDGREEASMNHLRDTLRLKPDYLPASTRLGDILFKRDQLDEAARNYEIGKGSIPQAAFGLGRIAARRQDWRKVIDTLAPVASRHPSFRPPHQLLADAYEKAGDPQNVALERRILLKPNLTTVPPPDDPVADALLAFCCSSTRLLKQAGFLSRFGESEQVIRLARRAVQVEPGDPDARYFLCRVLVKSRGDDPKTVDEALLHLNEGLRLRPDDLKPLLTVADIFFSQNKTDAAIEQLRNILARNADNAEAHYYLGIATERQGKVEEALDHYRNALKKSPNYAEPYHRLALALIKQERLDQGITYLRKAVNLKPSFTLAHYNLGLALEQKGDTKTAMAEYGEVLRLEPDDAAAHMNLGLLLAELGRYREATLHFREAVRIMPNDAEAHYDLGCALARQGNTAEAAAEFRKTLTLEPAYSEARKKLQQLTDVRP